MRRQRKKFLTPTHPWQKDRMDAEDKLLRRYGLKKKREIWRAETLLRNLRRQARRLLTLSGPQAELESKQLLERLQKLGVLKRDARLEDVLGLSVEDLLERRLQTLVVKRGLARTPRQARQLVVHGHVRVGDKKVTAPSYLVPSEEEGNIHLVPGAKPEGAEEGA